MPQIILLAALGAGVYAGVRALSRFAEQVSADLKRNQEAMRQHTRAEVRQKDGGTLELDPVSGVYKPVNGQH